MYVPNNSSVYLAAYAGCLAGLGASGKYLSDPVLGDYTLPAVSADAYSQAIDQAWGTMGPTQLELQSIKMISLAVWGSGRSPLVTSQASTAGAYFGLAQGVVALVQQGNAQVASQGINPNIGGVGNGEISFQDSAVGITLVTQNAFQLVNTWTTNQNAQGVTPNAAAGTLTILNPGWYQTICTLVIQSANNLGFKAALFINGLIHQNGKTQWTTSGISGSPIINIVIADVNLYAAGDVLDIRATCTSGSNVPITPLQGNFFAAQVG